MPLVASLAEVAGEPIPGKRIRWGRTVCNDREIVMKAILIPANAYIVVYIGIVKMQASLRNSLAK